MKTKEERLSEVDAKLKLHNDIYDRVSGIFGNEYDEVVLNVFGFSNQNEPTEEQLTELAEYLNTFMDAETGYIQTAIVASRPYKDYPIVKVVYDKLDFKVKTWLNELRNTK